MEKHDNGIEVRFVGEVPPDLVVKPEASVEGGAKERDDHEAKITIGNDIKVIVGFCKSHPLLAALLSSAVVGGIGGGSYLLHGCDDQRVQPSAVVSAAVSQAPSAVPVAENFDAGSMVDAAVLEDQSKNTSDKDKVPVTPADKSGANHNAKSLKDAPSVPPGFSDPLKMTDKQLLATGPKEFRDDADARRISGQLNAYAAQLNNGGLYTDETGKCKVSPSSVGTFNRGKGLVQEARAKQLGIKIAPTWDKCSP